MFSLVDNTHENYRLFIVICKPLVINVFSADMEGTWYLNSVFLIAWDESHCYKKNLHGLQEKNGGYHEKD